MSELVYDLVGTSLAGQDEAFPAEARIAVAGVNDLELDDLADQLLAVRNA